MWKNSFAYYEDEDGNYRDIFDNEIVKQNTNNNENNQIRIPS